MTPFIVAEMSANHLGRLRTALDIVDAAADAGADAIKLQTWTPGTMCVSDYKLERGPWAGRMLRDLYQEAFTPWEWHAPIFQRARERGLVPFSAAFDIGAVDFLETLGVDRHKVASFELIDLPLVRYVGRRRRPVILSTGMADVDEIAEAFGACALKVGAARVTLAVCTSSYPAEPADADLGRMRGLRGMCIGAQVGLSDHSLGLGVATAAAALGATYIEKHLTLDRSDGGPDAGFSMEPHEFGAMVAAVRQAAAAVAPRVGRYARGESRELRRSLWVVREVAAGEPLALGVHVRSARPGLGLHPDTDLIGRRAARDLRAGEPLTAECLS